MAGFSLQKLTKTFGPVTAVDGIDLEVDDGEFVAILGPSGCGKSTTLFLLSGIESPSSGRVLFDGRDVTSLEARERGIGLVFQSYALYPHLSVLDNICFPLEMLKIPREERRQRARAIADVVQIGELLSRRPHQLSGGQQQRVALARALVREPQLLLLDEPLSNLDASLRHAMRSEIRRLQRRLGLTTVLVTHDQIEATTMADRIVVMNRGRIEQIGSTDALYRRPANQFVAGFIGSPAINLVDIEVRTGQLRFGSATLVLSDARDGQVRVGVRPEHLRFASTGLSGKVGSIEPMGREVLYEIDTAHGLLRVLDPGHQVLYRENDAVTVDASPADLLVFDPVDGRSLSQA